MCGGRPPAATIHDNNGADWWGLWQLRNVELQQQIHDKTKVDDAIDHEQPINHCTAARQPRPTSNSIATERSMQPQR